MNSITAQHNTGLSSSSTPRSLSLQGSIQQLVLKSDPTAPDDQCEEDDPYVSVHQDTQTRPNTASVTEVVMASVRTHKPQQPQTWNYSSL